jgi:endothelin-converting enzyme
VCRAACADPWATERAPLLADSAAAGAAANPSFAERVSAVVQEPLTALSKLLLVLVLVFLLISSVFIGLFAGAQHKLNQRKNRPEPADPVPTITQTATATVPASRISTVYPPSPTKVPDHDDVSPALRDE